MLNVSYDTKPLTNPRIRLNIIDGFINSEKELLEKQIKEILSKPFGKSKKSIKKLYNKLRIEIDELNKELEKKRIFMIKLKGILSFRTPEAIKFLKELNETNVSVYGAKL